MGIQRTGPKGVGGEQPLQKGGEADKKLEKSALGIDPIAREKGIDLVGETFQKVRDGKMKLSKEHDVEIKAE